MTVKPKRPAEKKSIIHLRVTPAERKEFESAAWDRGMLLSAWIRAVLLQKVGKELGV